MIVFQIKGQSHRLSTLKGKEKDLIKLFSTYSTKYIENTEALGRQLSLARSKPQSAICNRCFPGPTRVLDANGISASRLL